MEDDREDILRWLFHFSRSRATGEGASFPDRELFAGLMTRACAMGRLSIMQWLYDNGLEEAVDEDRRGKTPLHISCEFGNLCMCQWLFDHGARGHTPRCSPDGSRTLLHRACRPGSLEVCAWLRAQGLCDSFVSVDGSGRTPLQEACLQGHPHLCDWLFEQDPGCIYRDTKARSRLTAAHCAAAGNSVSCAKWLLAHEDSSVSGTHSTMRAPRSADCMWSPLHAAVSTAAFDMVVWLLSLPSYAGCDAICEVGIEGSIALFGYAIEAVSRLPADFMLEPDKRSDITDDSDGHWARVRILAHLVQVLEARSPASGLSVDVLLGEGMLRRSAAPRLGGQNYDIVCLEAVSVLAKLEETPTWRYLVRHGCVPLCWPVLDCEFDVTGEVLELAMRTCEDFKWERSDGADRKVRAAATQVLATRSGFVAAALFGCKVSSGSLSLWKIGAAYAHYGLRKAVAEYAGVVTSAKEVRRVRRVLEDAARGGGDDGGSAFSVPSPPLPPATAVAAGARGSSHHGASCGV